MEIIDVVNELGQPTGAIVQRSEAHRLGIRHRTAHVWIVNGDQVLLQKRSLNKDSFPGCLDTSSAGHILTKDEPLTSALRELEEELGIKATKEDLKFIGTFKIQYEEVFHEEIFKDNEIAFVYVYSKKVNPQMLQLQAEEISEVVFYDFKKLYQEVVAGNPRFCVPFEGIELLKNKLFSKF